MSIFILLGINQVFSVGKDYGLDFKAIGSSSVSPAKSKVMEAEIYADKHGLDSSLKDFEDIDVAITDKKVNIGLSIMKNLYLSKGSIAGKKIRKLYDWEDKIFKLAGFKKLLDQGVEEKEAFIKSVRFTLIIQHLYLIL